VNQRAKAARSTPRTSAVTALLQTACERLPIGFALFDVDLQLAAWNARYAELRGYPAALLEAGTPLEAFVRFGAERGDYGKGDLGTLVRKRLAALKGGARKEHEQALPGGRVVRVTSEPVARAGVLLTCEDVTATRRTEERLRESAAGYELALRGISEGFYDWDIANGTIHYSARVRDAVGFSPEELETPGDWRSRIHPDDLERYDANHVAHFKGQTERFECEYRYRARDGSWRWARQHGVALRDARGRAYRMVGSTGDITELRHAEEALRASEQRQALAMRAAVEGIYEWDLATGTLFLSDRAKAFFAFPADGLGPEDWNARVHPDDFDAYRRAIAGHFRGRTPQIELEYRVRDAAGGYRWVLDRGVGVRNAAGRVTRLVGALSDVTQRKFAEIELRRARDDATAALGEQTALREVLEAISRSAFDLDAVLRTLIEHATRLVGAEKGFIFRLEGDTYRLAVDFAAPAAFREFIQRNPIRADSGGVVGLTARAGRTVHIDDATTDPRFRWLESQRLGGFRTMLGVPMLRDGRVVGVIALWKERVEPFTQAQIDLVTTFSNQALVAIENARLFKETKEALEQQTATAEILRAISSTPTDLATVYRTILASITRLCEANIAGLFLCDGEMLANAASHGTTVEFAEHLARGRFPPSRETTTRLAALERRTVQVANLLDDPGFAPEPRELYARENVRTVLSVPLLRDDVLVGVITTWRREVRPFSDKQVALVQTFADQAVIAIENVRLLNETTEALERQTATAEILASISGSLTDAQPVFDAIVQNLLRLFRTRFVVVQLLRGDRIELAAAHGHDEPEFARLAEQYPRPLDDRTAGGQVMRSGRILHLTPVLGNPLTPPATATWARSFGFNSLIAAPLVRGEKVIGAIVTAHRDAVPFDDKQIALIKTFADQAVIAIENVRLFNETKEALDQQRASAEVLSAISSSIADARPVFDRILERCQGLFGGRLVGINLVRDDGLLGLVAYHGPGREALERVFPLAVDRSSGSGTSIVERSVVHYPDAQHGAEVPDATRRGCTATGIRSVIFAPMLWEGRGIGVIFLGRDRLGSFSEKEIALLKTFADQAAIAIQNARLFNEIQEKSRQLEIADQHKSAFLANMSHELRTPLNAVIGFSEMLAARYFGELTAKQAEYVNDIHASGKHLLSLINDILDLSKIEAGRMELELSDFDLPAALDNALTLVRERAQRGGVALRLENDPRLQSYRGDERKLKQVVLNLLSNAVKFTPRGGAVSVVAKQVDGNAEIAVSDTGVGIAPADQEAIFEAFRQVGTDVTRKHEGTGLGLALARRFVELHGGTIRVASAPGKGSTFTVRLPLRRGE
jgi:PAS domain S-box-containing protein